ncbi:hypothetical protein MSAN_00418900 [Mycena sanguinolenta]|uniref:Uncharacterized protein n=1 Tax=Mycena sanguinolenta TaxID=230812 RepID=A0A8H6ZGR8_9AGAR|nr:hypothetical protein MSAN_00418900 [Mycena sanguinolenta]
MVCTQSTRPIRQKARKKFKAKERTKRPHCKRCPAQDHNILEQPMRTNLDNGADKRDVALGSGATSVFVQPETHSAFGSLSTSNTTMATEDVSQVVLPTFGAERSQIAAKSYYRPVGTVPQISHSHYRPRSRTNAMSSAAPIVFELCLVKGDAHKTHPDDDNSPRSNTPHNSSFEATDVFGIPTLATPHMPGRPGGDSNNDPVQSLRFLQNIC